MRWVLALLFLAAMPAPAKGPMLLSDERLVTTGRIDSSDNDAWRFDWGAVSLGFRFEGSDFALLLEDGNNDFNVYVDGQLKTIWRTRKGEERYEVSGLDPGEHRVRVVRRTEAGNGITVFKGVDLPRGGTLLEPGPGWHKARKLEFYGASWTCGYGNEGPGLICTDLRAVENADAAFPAYTAALLDADYQAVALSGRGIVRNYGEASIKSKEPFPILFDRVLMAKASPKWDFARFTPDAVVLNLGGNDYTTEPHADDAHYISEYSKLMKRVRQAYPRAWITCFVAAGWPGYHPKVRDAVARLKDSRVDVCTYEDFKNEEMGCDYHPKAWQHRVLAETLATHLKAKLGW